MQVVSGDGSDMMPVADLKYLPQHVAIIMDGNGRWAKKRHLPRLAGHGEGTIVAHRVVEVFLEYKIPYLTLYAFSTENWNRPEAEVDGLFRILEGRFDREVRFAQKKGIRVCHLGNSGGLPPRVQEKIKQALEITKGNSAMTVCLAANYGGRGEIVEAVRRIVLSGIQAQDVDETVVSQHLYTAGTPDPDLIIRTGGEMRLSNFLSWQAAYSEIYFTPVLWPDFGREEIDKALVDYSQRQRRFGSLVVE